MGYPWLYENGIAHENEIQLIVYALSTIFKLHSTNKCLLILTITWHDMSKRRAIFSNNEAKMFNNRIRLFSTCIMNTLCVSNYVDFAYVESVVARRSIFRFYFTLTLISLSLNLNLDLLWIHQSQTGDSIFDWQINLIKHSVLLF